FRGQRAELHACAASRLPRRRATRGQLRGAREQRGGMVGGGQRRQRRSRVHRSGGGARPRPFAPPHAPASRVPAAETCRVSGNREFAAFCGRKTAIASAALFPPFKTVINRAPHFSLSAIGDAWCHERFDGPFWTSAVVDCPAVSIVFVQSRDGNTVTDDPSSLGAGETDAHLIYEGLSRIAVDGVVVGASTLHAESFFSVWRRELVDARIARGLPVHPAQVGLTREGRVDG